MAASRSPKRTVFAQAGFDVATEFALEFTHTRVKGACEYRPVLAAPQAESTGGGKQVLQHVNLKPESASQPGIAAGWVNLRDRRATIRSYPCLRQLHAQRYPNRPFEIDAGSYDAFFRAVHGFLALRQISVTVEHAVSMSHEPRASRGSTLARLAAYGCALPVIVLSVLVIVGAYLWFYHRDDLHFAARFLDEGLPSSSGRRIRGARHATAQWSPLGQPIASAP